MTVFMLETDSVSSAASAYDSMATQVSDLASSVNGYDTSCDDGDLSSAFASAKGVISSNLDACSTKIKNVSAVLNSVVSSHTSLQNSLKFQSSEDKAAAQASAGSKSPSPVSSGGGGGGGYSGGGGGYSGGGGSSGGGGGTGGSSNDTKDNDEKNKDNKELTDEEKQNILDKVGTEIYSEDEARQNMVDLAKTQLGNSDISEYLKMFNEGEGTLWCSEFVAWLAMKCGYIDAGIIPKFAGAGDGAAWFKKHGLLKDRSYTPKPGDIIFTGGDSATHTAMVVEVKNGKIYTIEGGGSKVRNGSYSIGSSNIYGFGTPDYSKVVIEQPKEVKSAVDWATKIAKDNSYGYGNDQAAQSGDNKQYSGLGLVREAYRNAGIKLEDTDITKFDQALTKSGFEDVTSKVDIKTGKGLQRGDVLWVSTKDGKGHTEIAAGHGKLIGSRGAKDSTAGDSTGEEISVIDYFNNSWTKIFRYTNKSKDLNKDAVLV